MMNRNRNDSISKSNLIEMESNRKVLTLPRVEHPSKKINSIDQQTLDIRGRSTNTSLSHSNDHQQLIRNEFNNDQPFSRLSSHRKYSFSRKSSSTSQRIRLPIFGYSHSHSHSHSNGNENENEINHRRSSIRREENESILTTAELWEILREKVSKQKKEIERKFRQLSNGNSNMKISRQAFRHLILSIFGVQCQLNSDQIDSILKRFYFKDEQQINYEDFLFQLNLFSMKTIDRIVEESSRSSSSSSNSFSSINNDQELFHKPTAEQMFDILKDKIQSKSDDLIEYFPSLTTSTSNSSKTKLYRNEFRQNLIRLGFHFDDYQFNKLWKRFDPDGFHSIDLEKILHLIRNEEFLIENSRSKQIISETQDQLQSIVHHEYQRNSQRSIETPRLTTAENDLTTKQIQLWILHKFPQGFSDLEKSLEKFDEKQNGFIRRDDFFNVFRSFGFVFDENHLERFLHRLNISLKSNENQFIPYRNVLQALKEKSLSTNSIPKQMKSILSTSDETLEKSLFGQIEYLIRMNFDRIEKELNDLDLSSKGILSSDQWKDFIENLIQFHLNPNEFFILKKSFPQDQQGNIRWKDFIQQIQKKSFSTNQTNKSLDLTTTKIPSWDYMRSKNIRERLDLQHIDKNKIRKTNILDRTTNDKSHRSFEQLYQLIKKLIRDRYKDVEEQFHQLDQSSYGELTKDLLFQLFRRLSIEPEVNRSEIDLIWSRCHLKENGNLDFYQFLREFGYSKRSAHYPNAKQNPPRRGDADFLLTSRKLYGDSVLVHGTALNAIRSNWNQLRREFIQLDPYRTGFIQSDEFDEILIDLCPSVNQEDLEILREKFQNKNDFRTNYIRFLKYHSPLGEFRDEIRSIDYSSNQQISFDQLKRKIRSKLIDKEKSLRRTFRENDRNNLGKISVGKFKKILDENHCHLNDEEFYFLLSQFQQSIDGFIHYQQFIERFIH